MSHISDARSTGFDESQYSSLDSIDHDLRIGILFVIYRRYEVFDKVDLIGERILLWCRGLIKIYKIEMTMCIHESRHQDASMFLDLGIRIFVSQILKTAKGMNFTELYRYGAILGDGSTVCHR